MSMLFYGNGRDLVGTSARCAVVALSFAAGWFCARLRRRIARRDSGESAERLELAEEVAGFGVWELDLTTGRIALSRGAALVSGLSPDVKQISKEELDQRIYPEDRIPVLSAAKQAISHRQAYQVDFRVSLPDGNVRWCRVQGKVKRVDRRAAKIIGAIIDISKEKSMMQQLHESADRMRLAEDAAHFGIWENDFVSGMMTVSGGLVALFGGPKGPARRIPIEQYAKSMNPDHLAAVNAAVERAVATRQPFCVEIESSGEDEAVRWHRIQGRVEFAGERPERVVGATIDISREKHMQFSLDQARARAEAAMEANAELASIIDCAGTAIISHDLSGKVLTWNRGAERLYGFSAGEMVGSTIAMLLPSGRSEEDAAVMDKLRQGEATHLLETTRLTKSQGLIHLLLTLSPIRNQAGEIVAAAQLAWDVTHIKQMEQQLAHAQKLEAIGQLAAGIAHEVNTPIQYIGDNGKFLEDAFRDLIGLVQPRVGGDPGPAQQNAPQNLPGNERDESELAYYRTEIPRAIHQLLEGVERVTGIVHAMREFSHPGPVEKTPADINQGIESTIIVSRNEWKYVAEVTTDLDPDMPPVPCLAGELNQVMLNLIVNSAHAISEKVKGSGAKGKIHICTRHDESYVEIRVSDTGPGVPAAIQSKIFDPFFTTKPVGRGTGQGLAIAHAVVVQKHGGTIRLESAPGEGATFVIRLPLALQPVTA